MVGLLEGTESGSIKIVDVAVKEVFIIRIDRVVVEEDIEVAMTDTRGTELSGLHLLTPARDREERMEGKDLSDSREEGEIGLERQDLVSGKK